MEFCEKVRQETRVYWEASFNHPFVQGIALYASEEMLQSIEKQKSMLNRFAKEQPMKQKILKAHFEKKLLLRVAVLGNVMDDAKLDKGCI